MRTKLRTVYTSQLGVQEAHNRNDGPQVARYLRYVHLEPGNAWCAAFVCWALGQAGIANPRSGWSPDLFPGKRLVWKHNGNLHRRPQSGDVFGIWIAGKGRMAHCGFVDTWGNDMVITVEGNTNVQGSTDGDGVYRKRRPVSSLYAVADWVSAPKEPKP